MIEAYQAVVLVPYGSALVLAALPSYRVGAIGNVAASAATFAAGLWLLTGRQLIGARFPSEVSSSARGGFAG